MEFIKEAFEANWISPAGPHLAGFEGDIGSYLGGISVAALSSGTAAIHLALIMLGVGPGDEVICSTFTFSGTCNPIVYQKAVPVFVDSEPDTWNMDPNTLRIAILNRMSKGKKPKAIVVVHLYGMPAKMDEIISVANEFEIPVIEDAAEALGSSYKGKKCGTFGAIGVLSFNGNKIITTSGGGALTSWDRGKVEKAKFLATQARDPAPHYQHSEIGYNYRLSNISAGIGRGQMAVLDDRVRQRRQVYTFYENHLKSDFILFQPEIEGSFSNRWLTCLYFPLGKPELGEQIRICLEKDNIESRPLWKPMHLQPVFESFPVFETGVSQRLFENGICLPSGSNLSDLDLHRVVQIVKEIVD